MARPAAATVFGVLYVTLGVLGVLGTPVVMLLPFMYRDLGLGGGNLYSESMQMYILVSGGFQVLIATVMLTAGVGLLKLQPWGRSTALVVAGATLVFSVASGLAAASLLSRPAEGDAFLGAMAQAQHSAALGAIVRHVLGAAFAVSAVWCLSQPAVRAAFLAPASEEDVLSV